jgi:hypothetical protein
VSLLKVLIAVLLLAPAAAAQECPRVEVTCPAEMSEQGAPMTFGAKISGGDPNAQLTFNWTVSVGTITSGQGTPTITVDTTGLGGLNVKATLEVGGLPESCPRAESCEAGVKPPPLIPHAFDRYAYLRFEDEIARLDNFVIQLQHGTEFKGYILVYAGERVSPREARERARSALSYLVKTRGADPARVVLVYGGVQHGETVLWFLPNDVKFPFPGQVIKPTGGEGRAGRRRKP